MWPDARLVPKTLLLVAGRSFADWQLGWLADAGVTSVVYCIGFLGEQIRAHVGDGSRWGLEVTYVDEASDLRGTAGALRLGAQQDVLEPRFLVLYGDSWLQIDPAGVMHASEESGRPALMTVFENTGSWDTSNVVYAAGTVIRYAKGLDPVPPEMRWIDYGLSVFTRELIEQRVPVGVPADLAVLCSALAEAGDLAGFEARHRFHEIGSPAGFGELDELLRAR